MHCDVDVSKPMLKLHWKSSGCLQAQDETLRVGEPQRPCPSTKQGRREEKGREREERYRGQTAELGDIHVFLYSYYLYLNFRKINVISTIGGSLATHYIN